MVGGAKIPQTCTSSGVRSTEEMDSAINDLTSKFANPVPILRDSMIIMGVTNLQNEFGDMRTSWLQMRKEKRLYRSSIEVIGEAIRIMVSQNVNPRGYGKRQSYRVKAEIPNFARNLDIEVVLDWLYEVKKFFDIIEVPKEEQVKVVAYKLHGGAGAWWQREQDNRRAQGRRPVDTWMRMKWMIKETDEQSVARYISGLNSSIKERLSLTPIWYVDQAQNIAMNAERMASKLGVSSKVCGTGVDKNKESQPINSNPYARPTSDKCFRCGELGHRSNVCPKRSTYYSVESGNKGLIIDEVFQEEDEELKYTKPLDGELLSSQPNPILVLIRLGGFKGPTLKGDGDCKAHLAIGKHYNELVTCDVVDMEACHVLLERPKQHGVDATHQVASPKEFQAKRKETGVSYALVVKGVEDDMENAISTVNRISFHITFAMSTQQDIYDAGSENRPPMLNKDNYVPWSSRLLRYAKSKPNGKLLYNFIMHGLFVKRMIPEPGDPDRDVPNAETFHEQTNEELTKKDIKQMEADDQAIQTILMGLPEDIYVVVDSCETTQEIWLRVQQMMKGSDIRLKRKRLNCLMNGKGLLLLTGNRLNLTIITKDLHQVDYTQLYDLLMMNQEEVNELRAERLAKTHDPLALMENC
ncbi:retrotransposon protein, putative, ty3-gypsy subclass [Tanacetum coccineum]